jgi:hypothetical protein
MSTLIVKNLQGIYPSNQVTIPAGQTLYAPGHVLQIQSTTLNTYQTTTSTSYVNITGFSVNITPKSTSSKIFIQCYAHMTSYGQNGSYLRVLRNGSLMAASMGASSQANAINDGTGGTVVASSGFITYAASNAYTVVPLRLDYLDSPATTGILTYQAQWRVGTGNTTYFNCHRDSGGTNADFGWYASTISVWEIAA